MSSLCAEATKALEAAGMPKEHMDAAVRRVARGMIRRFGGQMVYVPRTNRDAHETAQKAFSLHVQGVARRDIAQRLVVSERWVSTLIQRGRDLRPSDKENQ